MSKLLPESTNEAVYDAVQTILGVAASQYGDRLQVGHMLDFLQYMFDQLLQDVASDGGSHEAIRMIDDMIRVFLMGRDVVVHHSNSILDEVNELIKAT